MKSLYQTGSTLGTQNDFVLSLKLLLLSRILKILKSITRALREQRGGAPNPVFGGVWVRSFFETKI